MKIKVTQSPLYAHGHALRLLGQVGATIRKSDPEGDIEAEATQYQVDQFQLRGMAHHIEVIPEAPPTPPAPVTPREVYVPTIEEVEAAGYSHETALKIRGRQMRIAQLFASGMTEEQVRVVIEEWEPIPAPVPSVGGSD